MVTPTVMTVLTDDADLPQRPSDRPSRFHNLTTAGRELAVALERYRDLSNIIVLGIVSGGVPVAYEVARHLNAPLDFVLKRTLLAPMGPGSQLSAVNVAGSLVLPRELLPLPSLPSRPFDYFLADAITTLNDRERTCRGGRSPRNLHGQIVILVDCGIRTSLTMQRSIIAVRTRSPAQIIAAVPVGSTDGCASTATMVDEFVCLAQPEPFGHVGMCYEDFKRPKDEEIQTLLGPG